MKFFSYIRQQRRKRMQNQSGCKYPIGDPQSKNFRFCCEPIERSRFVYCDEHAR
jgi:hypothetical protein